RDRQLMCHSAERENASRKYSNESAGSFASKLTNCRIHWAMRQPTINWNRPREKNLALYRPTDRLKIDISPIDASAVKACMLVAATALALLGLQLPGSAQSAQDYPARQVTFVVSLAPGEAIDIFARAFAQKLNDKYGKPFVVEIRHANSPYSD